MSLIIMEVKSTVEMRRQQKCAWLDRTARKAAEDTISKKKDADFESPTHRSTALETKANLPNQDQRK